MSQGVILGGVLADNNEAGGAISDDPEEDPLGGDTAGSPDHSFQRVRAQTAALAEGLSPEDLVAQSMPDASPGKWHLAHTTWFFETFILQKFEDSFSWFDEKFCYLFNSYYDTVGERHARPQRGLLTRPGLEEVMEYRRDVDARMSVLMAQKPGDFDFLLTIGLHHEMQHQELFLTDLLHLLSCNPLHPQVITPAAAEQRSAGTGEFVAFEGGLTEVGARRDDGYWQYFSYDCEQPRHTCYLTPFALAAGLVTNGEWLDFMADGGYDNPLLWLSDGWAQRQQAKWQAPLYWQYVDGCWQQYGLDGLRPLQPAAPVCHVSFYEADAYARWAGRRLPREHEWEHAAASQAVAGNFLEARRWRPAVAKARTATGKFSGL